MTIMNFTHFPNMATEHLNLRQVRLEDQNEIFILKSNKEVTKFFDRQKIKTIDEAQQFIEKSSDGIAKNERILWAITLKNEDKLIGTICLWNISKEKSSAEIGYDLIPEYQGKGIMQEALFKVCKYGFENMELHSIEAFTNLNNLKSIRLLERNNFIMKANFEDCYSYEGKTLNMVIYALTNDDKK